MYVKRSKPQYEIPFVDLPLSPVCIKLPPNFYIDWAVIMANCYDMKSWRKLNEGGGSNFRIPLIIFVSDK